MSTRGLNGLDTRVMREGNLLVVTAHHADFPGNIGSIYAKSFSDGFVWIRSLTVHERYLRGQGIGTALMDTFCQEVDRMMRESGLTPKPLDAFTQRTRLEAFYKRFGFLPQPEQLAWLREARREPAAALA